MQSTPFLDEEDFDSSDGEPSFADLLMERTHQSYFDNKKQDFLPEGTLQNLLSRRSIVKEMPQLANSEVEAERLIDFILCQANKVFAITIYTGIDGPSLLKAMANFHKHDFNDALLPTSRIGQTNQGPFGLKIWTKLNIKKFCDSQWQFLAPVFSPTDFVYHLSTESILPFTWKNEIIIGGYFSQVSEVEIHPSHQAEPNMTVDGKLAHFAVKEIIASTMLQKVDLIKNWESEARTLDDLSDLNHPHIIQCVAAITRGEKRYFIFPWADGGSLRDFWQVNSTPHLSPGLIKEVIEQFLGLTNALCGLHHFKRTENYRHGDLKPDNILRFKTHTDDSRLGILKIADLGLAKRHHDPTEMRRAPSGTLYGTARYESPEARSLPGKARSRLYDIWSMGCIILELIVWLLYGYEEVQRLQKIVDSDPPYGGGSYFQ
ncbi:hypothetical protein TruAng_002622 [Truncatella angustata]|nr:hypothetical protein TruAng_002622 [Truncatella angustata]